MRRVFAALIISGLTLGVFAQAPVRARKPAASKSKAAPQKKSSSRTSPSDQVEAWMNRLTLRQQVAQLLVVKFYGEALPAKSKEFRDLDRLVRQTGIGGLIVLNRVRNGLTVNAEPHAMASFINRMQRAASIPLIVGGDFERGASMRVANTVKFPHNMAYAAAKDLEGTRFLGLHTAREARALGVHWVFAPTADVNNNADNPVINLRSFSENPDEVAAHVRAFIEGAHSDPANKVLLSAKHFPGHGDTATDSHLGLANIPGDKARLDAVELKPFRAAIDAGVDSIMTAHLTVPALEPEPIPATVSYKIMTDLLKKELGFKGLVTTDAMDMFGLSKQFSPDEAAVRAIEAGVDVLLVPPDPEKAITGVVQAVQSGRISRARLRQSVMKVLAAKVHLGLHRHRLVNIENIPEVIDSPEAAEKAQQTADHALTLVRNEKSIFPLKAPETTCVYVLSVNQYSLLGQRFLEELKLRMPAVKTQRLDVSLDDVAFDEAAADAKQCSAVVVASFATGISSQGSNSLALPANLTRFVNLLIQNPVPVGLISFGNPYLLRNFPDVAAYIDGYSTVPTSEVAMAKALAGEIHFRGKMVVTIPGIADYGSGITQ